MVDDRIKLLVQRLATEKWHPIQAQRWVDELYGQMHERRETVYLVPGLFGPAVPLDEWVQTQLDDHDKLVERIRAIAEQHPECSGCCEIVEELSPIAIG